MDLIPSDDQQQIIDLAADFILNELPLTRLFDAHYDADRARAQRKAVAELGWFGIGLPEESGGVGMTVVEEAFILRELGRVIGPTAIIPAILAAKLAARLDLTELRDRLLLGEAAAALAIGEEPLTASADQVIGTARVYDIQDAACIIATVGNEALLLGVSPSDLQPTPWLDSFTPVARRNLFGLPILGRAPLQETSQNGMLLTAAMLTGLAEGALGMIQEYAGIRETFGRKIGAYQAVRIRSPKVRRAAIMRSRCSTSPRSPCAMAAMMRRYSSRRPRSSPTAPPPATPTSTSSCTVASASRQICPRIIS